MPAPTEVPLRGGAGESASAAAATPPTIRATTAAPTRRCFTDLNMHILCVDGLDVDGKETSLPALFGATPATDGSTDPAVRIERRRCALRRVRRRRVAHVGRSAAFG